MAKVLIWLASGDRAKLMPGLIWGLNAKRRSWVDEVKVVVFGDSEKTMMEDDELYSLVHEIEGTTFCKQVAENEGRLAELEKKGAKVVYVGEPIAKAINEGYTVLTF